MIDQTGDIRRPESVINVDHRDARRTAVEHAEEGGNAAETGAVADAGGDGDNRDAHQTRDHTRQRPFHAGNHDDGARGGKPLTLAEKPVKTSNPDVVNALDRISHQLGRNGGFFGDGLIGSSCRGDDNDALSRRHILLTECNDARIGVVRGRRHNGANSIEGFDARARDQKRGTTPDDFLTDRRNLSRRLSETEHDFGEALPYGSMVINFRKAEILERAGSKRLDEMLECFAGLDVTACDTIQ
ncbi:MAG TPA: hypothetical protein VKB36_03545 [Vicinamibacterales bacterium]|nr:hypothetical protein [Vicinamibacterales bacterium]